MIEMELSRIVIDETKKEQIIVLKEKGGQQTLPIVIGMSEVTAIKMTLGGLKPPRPLSHDLMFSIIEALGARLEKVVIDNLVEGVFHAKLYINNKGAMIKIVDARPSDGVALAVRAKSPIFVHSQVFDKLS
ncbi:MAG: bifunctional nuclease family protein [Candidatus Omnitrophica bacterium]|nr:bifunctional nuclease family protein [Candidatus Omnitrophota bacterium]MDD5429816.1 bifunctional nuclease family protein [Candidatus Omnitrophota bacterium]